MTKNPEDLLDGLAPPIPRASLRERILAAAHAETPRPDIARGFIDRLWESRSLRWGWAVLVSALLCGHVALLRTDPRPSASAAIATQADLDRARILDALMQADLADSSSKGIP